MDCWLLFSEQVRFIAVDEVVIDGVRTDRHDQRREYDSGDKRPSSGRRRRPLTVFKQDRSECQNGRRHQSHPGLKAERFDAINLLHQHRASGAGEGAGGDEPEPRRKRKSTGPPGHDQHADQCQRDAQSAALVDTLAEHQHREQHGKGDTELQNNRGLRR